MEKCIVTGGTGHIGNVLIKKLLKLNKKVTAIVLPNEDLTPLKDLDIEIVYGDVCDRDFIFKTLKGNVTVFHLAGIINIGTTDIDKVYKVNVEGTKNVVDACVENKIPKFVYTSSVHIIEPVKNKVLLEPDVFDENKIIGDYAKTKCIATKYVLDSCDKGLNATVVYPSGVIGPCDYKISELGQVIIDYINKKLFAYVKGGYNFVDVRDVADGIISAAEKGGKKEGYILSGYTVTLKEMFTIINEKIGRTKFPAKLALWFVKMFAKLSDLYYKVRKKKPVFSSYSLYTLNSNSNFSNEKAKQQLGYNTRPVEESICDAIDWFKTNKPECFETNKKSKNKEQLNNIRLKMK